MKKREFVKEASLVHWRILVEIGNIGDCLMFLYIDVPMTDFNLLFFYKGTFITLYS